jgi:hypothetical protein
MNPFNNKWLALALVAGVLLIVSELVGTGEDAGVLSQAAGTNYAANGTGEPLPPGVVQAVGPAVDAAESNPDDEPEVVLPDATVDAEDAAPEEIEEPQIEPDAMGEAQEFDESGDEFTDDSGE